MNRIHLFAASMLIACSTLASAQPATATAVAVATVVVPAEARQFDFLMGQWTIDVHPKVSGLVAMIHGTPTFVGTWRGTRSADGLGVEDEVRIVDGSGNPITSNRGRRTYVKAQGCWKITETDSQRGRASESTGHWLGGEMRLSGHFTEADGTLTLTRTRYYNISAQGFHMQQDRSTDNGKSWEEGSLIIDARRTAATR